MCTRLYAPKLVSKFEQTENGVFVNVPKYTCSMLMCTQTSAFGQLTSSVNNKCAIAQRAIASIHDASNQCAPKLYFLVFAIEQTLNARVSAIGVEAKTQFLDFFSNMRPVAAQQEEQQTTPTAKLTKR